jgi:hypothetical protein
MVTRMVAVITQRDMPKDAKRHQNRAKTTRWRPTHQLRDYSRILLYLIKLGFSNTVKIVCMIPQFKKKNQTGV